MAIFAEYAPMLDSVGVTKTDCDDIVMSDKTSSTAPVVTKEKAMAVLQWFNKLEQIGYTKLAHTVKLSVGQVKTIHREFLAAKSADIKAIEGVEIGEI